jgi:hypothetical protein
MTSSTETFQMAHILREHCPEHTTVFARIARHLPVFFRHNEVADRIAQVAWALGLVAERFTEWRRRRVA